MTYFYIVIQQIGVFVIYALIGVLALKLKVVSQEGLEWISRLVIKILLPLMIFTNTINGATREDFLASLPLLYATAIMYFLVFFLTKGLTRLAGLKGNEKNSYHACSMFGNIGFMGIPLISALIPEKGMLYVALFTVVDQLVLWTVGLTLCFPVEGGKKLSPKETALKMINPNTVGILLAMFFVLTGLKLPTVINTALTKTGAAATPLAMIYLGGLFCSVNFKESLLRKEFYLTILVKMIAFPVLFYRLIAYLPGMNSDMCLVMAVVTAVPTMTSIPMLIKAQHSAGEYAAGMVFVTTVCSIISIPIVCLLL